MEAAAGYATTNDHGRRDGVVGWWLLALSAMVFIMVVMGGLTRLTESGLSIVDLRPLTGWLPPLGEAEWRATFDQYKLYPEFKQVNSSFDLADFKSIFFLEYFHRLWGRLIGIAFFMPFVYFVARGWVGRHLGPRLAIVFLLGAAQGGLGWFMVQSGLVDRPEVSQYRLTAHLGAALVIYAYMLWLGLSLIGRGRGGRADAPGLAGIRRFTLLIAAWTFVTMLSGGFVAGLDAGLVYNTFPLMDGRLIPDGLMSVTPWYANFFENLTTVQFDHRILAETLVVLVFVLWWCARKFAMPGAARLAYHALGAMVVLQLALGIATLVLAVPLALASVHQAGALVLLTLGLWAAREISPA